MPKYYLSSSLHQKRVTALRCCMLQPLKFRPYSLLLHCGAGDRYFCLVNPSFKSLGWAAQQHLPCLSNNRYCPEHYHEMAPTNSFHICRPVSVTWHARTFLLADLCCVLSEAPFKSLWCCNYFLCMFLPIVPTGYPLPRAHLCLSPRWPSMIPGRLLAHNSPNSRHGATELQNR